MSPQNFRSKFGAPQQPASCLSTGHGHPAAWQAINTLTPSLFRAASEQRTIYGSVQEAILINLFGNVSFAASGNFRIRGHNGKAMPLTLHLRFAGPPLSGKSDTHDRFNAPVVEAMKGWKKRWLFDNVTPATLLRKIRSGSVLSMLSMAEGRGHLGDQVSGQLSRSFQELNDLYDSHVPALDRADDDDDELVENAPDSAIFVTCVNVQNDKHRAWLDKHAQDASGSGYLYRLLMMEAVEVAMEGAGSQQREVALLDYDQRIVELIASARLNLEATPASQLPVIDVPPEAEKVLRQAQERFVQMPGSFLSSNDARVFAVRLAANTRRIAGCMHVFERCEGPISVDTMTRATTIAECFSAHWLSTVFPPKATPDGVQRGQRLLDALHNLARQSGRWTPSWREADIVTLAPNFGWSKVEMKAAITAICGAGFAQVVPRIENGRRVIKLELIPNSVPTF
ncbi:DUF3987 domain-containing protein [Paraburkholderia sp. GAS32]|uniref:DUF3987 domain-containing protein n=1 Tax=Paraburkholderia sp. GAS32 TaxID=3035129 RepID=UPI003D19BDC9